MELIEGLYLVTTTVLAGASGSDFSRPADPRRLRQPPCRTARRIVVPVSIRIPTPLSRDVFTRAAAVGSWLSDPTLRTRSVFR